MQKKRSRLGAFFNVIKNKNILKCPYDNCVRTFNELDCKSRYFIP